MDNQVEEIKRKLDIVNVISKYLPLKKRGRHYMACCPFHGEKTPSFMVSPELQIFKCFGCGRGGDIFTFVQDYEKIDFREALEDLAKLAGITLVHSAALSQSEIYKKRLLEINTHTARFYHYVLLNHPLGKDALDYVLNRGISLDTIKLFQIGFCPFRNDSLVKLLMSKGYKPDELIATGTFGKSQYGNHFYDRFGDRLIFPLCDYRDRIVGFSGRILPGDNSQEHAKYINSPETDIYHKGHMVYGLNLAKDAIKSEGSVLVVEGEFDMISPYQLGIKNIIALKGTAFTQDQLQLLKRYTNSLILALDSDFAGNNAAHKSIELAESLGMEIKVMTLGDKYKDPDEAVKADPEYFRQRLTQLTPIWDYLIETAVTAHGTDSIMGKKKIMSSVLPFLIKIDNAVIKSDYFHKLAAVLGTEEDTLKQESQKYFVKNSSESIQPLTVTSRLSSSVKDWSESNSQLEKKEEYVLILIFGTQKPVVVAKQLKESLEVITLPKYKNILAHLLAQKDFEPREFISTLPPELQTIFQNIYLASTSLDIDSQKRAKEIDKSLKYLSILSIKSKIKELSSKIALIDDNASDEANSEYDAEVKRLTSKLSKLQANK